MVHKKRPYLLYNAFMPRVVAEIEEVVIKTKDGYEYHFDAKKLITANAKPVNGGKYTILDVYLHMRGNIVDIMRPSEKTAVIKQ